MYNYCWSNPVVLSDSAGMDPLTQTIVDDSTPWDDHEHYGCGGGGGGGWGAFIRTMQSAANGLTMPMGRTNMALTERHHLYSNKNKTYTPKFKAITDKYGVSLNGSDNIVLLPGHKGRHTNAYHELMLLSLEQIDAIAAGNVAVFLEGLGIMRDFLKDNPWLPYGK